ncbi:unnamed protein product [Allacma fusca]|uniref:Uncharacterized protein n=2 Tax=Allacma fusca TaxID=39272 RepID=A0A8J2KNX9_9HEXA|nr:unnamed protein product [Allacma fusca]
MLDAPLERSAVIFGIWSYTTHALTSCQGLILACLYCFWNGEVQLALKKFVRYKIFNGSKYRGSGSGRGSVRMSLMNNTSAAGRAVNGVTLVPQPVRVELLNGPGTNPQPNSFRSSPAKSSNLDANRAHIDGTVPALSQIPNSGRNRKLLEESTSDGDNSMSCTSVRVSGNSDQNSTTRGSKFRRLSKLRIWISPVMFVSGAKKQNSESVLNPPKTVYNHSPEVDSEERDTLNMSSTEGCHFQIEVLEDVHVK